MSGAIRPRFGATTSLSQEDITMAKVTPDVVNSNPAAPVPATSLNYRPRYYFGHYDLQTTLLTQVKGTARRNVLREALENGRIDEVPDAFKGAALSEVGRQHIGRIHPSCMGGEYLPGAKGSEIEIARIRIDSTTGDVTSVYARRVGQRIAYRVVDEYQGDTLSGRTRRTSNKPLTMGQMIEFFLGAWDLYLCLDCNFDGDLGEMLGFFEGESEFYPCFDAELRRRVKDRFAPQSDDTPENNIAPARLTH